MRKLIISMSSWPRCGQPGRRIHQRAGRFRGAEVRGVVGGREGRIPGDHAKGTEDFLSLYELQGQSVLGLKPCALELRFVDDQLYEIQFACEPRARWPAALRKRFGEPTQEKAEGLVWMGERATVGVNQAGLFSFSDRRRAQIASQKLLCYIIGARRRQRR